MIKNILYTSFLVLLFTACSTKEPKINLETELQEANKCQKIDKKNLKLECYNKILDKNSFAQLRIGIYNAEKYSFKKAVELLNKSNQNENPYSNLALAFLYFKGQGVEKNLEKSFNLLNASSKIDPNAAFRLSKFYFEGIVVQKNPKKGLSLVEFAANKNMKLAQENLFNIYYKGLFGVKKDEKKAIYWKNKLKDNKKAEVFQYYKM